MALHTYTTYEWKNAPDHKTTPMSADNLNHIEQGIKNAEDDVAEVDANRKTDIAYVESETTASRAYSVGELVYISGVLYKVITAIASGASFTVNTNVSAVNISEAILQRAPYPDFSKTSLGSITTPSGSFTATKDCYCMGTITNANGGQAIVYVNGYIIAGTNNNTVSFSFPFKKGWSMTTRATYGAYGITFFDV